MPKVTPNTQPNTQNDEPHVEAVSHTLSVVGMYWFLWAMGYFALPVSVWKWPLIAVCMAFGHLLLIILWSVERTETKIEYLISNLPVADDRDTEAPLGAEAAQSSSP